MEIYEEIVKCYCNIREVTPSPPPGNSLGTKTKHHDPLLAPISPLNMEAITI